LLKLRDALIDAPLPYLVQRPPDFPAVTMDCRQFLQLLGDFIEVEAALCASVIR